jgi:colanic acid biosynthesis glycosyl transferase WcaI
MRIVLLNQFYPPDLAPTGVYLHDLARQLVRSGHEVSVLASRHAYGGGGEFAAFERLDGVAVHRLPGSAFGRSSLGGKLADYATYYLQLAARLLDRFDPELVVSLTTPPYVGLLAKALAALKGIQHSHWVMDVYPDVMEAHGMSNPALSPVLRGLTRWTFRGAHSVLTLGPAMATRIRRYAPDARVHWVPLWAPSGLEPWPGDTPNALRRERGWELERPVLLYSGNFGSGHRFCEYLEAARQLGKSGPRWAFAGDGRARPQLEQFCRDHADLPVELHPYAPESQLREHLCSADVHLVSMSSAWEGTLLPSKLQASFAVAKPVIVLGRPDLDIARWVLEADGGWVVAEDDVPGLLGAVAEACDPAERRRRGENALAFARERFDSQRNIDAAIELLVPA